VPLGGSRGRFDSLGSNMRVEKSSKGKSQSQTTFQKKRLHTLLLFPYGTKKPSNCSFHHHHHQREITDQILYPMSCPREKHKIHFWFMPPNTTTIDKKTKPTIQTKKKYQLM